MIWQFLAARPALPGHSHNDGHGKHAQNAAPQDGPTGISRLSHFLSLSGHATTALRETRRHGKYHAAASSCWRKRTILIDFWLVGWDSESSGVSKAAKRFIYNLLYGSHLVYRFVYN
jgi:hypothetical protein